MHSPAGVLLYRNQYLHALQQHGISYRGAKTGSGKDSLLTAPGSFVLYIHYETAHLFGF